MSWTRVWPLGCCASARPSFEPGNLLETFVVNELLKQVTWLDQPVTVGHWRTYDGDEVDFVVEDDEGRVLAIEVKSGDRVPAAQLSGLAS
jgi:hypothetical protein